MNFSKINEQLNGKRLKFPFFTEDGYVWVPNIPLKERDIKALQEEGFTHAFIEEPLTTLEDFNFNMLDLLQNSIKKELYVTIKKTINNSKYFQLLITAINDYDKKTFQHSLATTSIALKMCEALNYSELDILRTATAALLHDIGKCCLPKTLLNRTGVLDERARWLMEKHVWYSYLIISDIWDSDLATMVYTHHERVDGTGYPRKLRGDELSELSKILMIADVFSALTEKRPYKEAYTKQTALNIIKNCFCSEKKLYDLLEDL